MSDVEKSHLAGAEGRLRHRPLPFRMFGDSVIVARPNDGTSVVIASAATLVWKALEGWSAPDEIDRRLALAFPDVPAAKRVAARKAALQMLQDEDLLERA